MLRPGSLALTLLLAMLTGIGPLSVDMYLASLPSIGRLLGAPTSQVQLTISASRFGRETTRFPRTASVASRRLLNLKLTSSGGCVPFAG